MKGVIKKEILNDLRQILEVFESNNPKVRQVLEKLSNHAVEDVALYKDLDIISITVLIYSLHKTIRCLTTTHKLQLVKALQRAIGALESGNLGKYNANIKQLFFVVKECNADVKNHLQDVMQAAKIKKGTALLQKGLSMGQAAGLMGLSNWDLQEYAAKTTALSEHTESMRASIRLDQAFTLFGISPSNQVSSNKKQAVVKR
jgi:hypothetical protein